MSGGQLTLPIVFRGPGGAAHQLAAQHSQVVENLYAYVPGLKVVSPSTPYDAKGLLKSAIRDENPIVFIEGEVLYGRKGPVPDEEYTLPLGKGDVKREGTDVTIIAWSKMVYIAQDAATELAKSGIEAEVIDPRTIRPLDEELILKSVKKTNRCVIVEEGWPFAGAGAEISYRVTNKAFDYLDAPVVRVTGEDVPMPYAKNLEHLVLPSVEKVVKAVKGVLYRT
jgi:pyruvate dehydrogenase E1 component beta subunit